jgi:NodT family efflux transporter outer membrane factor (OMF) lipoprotein
MKLEFRNPNFEALTMPSNSAASRQRLDCACLQHRFGGWPVTNRANGIDRDPSVVRAESGGHPHALQTLRERANANANRVSISVSAIFRISDFGLRISSAAMIVSVLIAVLLAGCAVGPDYHRPTVDEPASYRASAAAGTNTFADLGWWDVFEDPQLSAYLGEALTNNWDVKIAAARVLQAEAALQGARSQYFPNVSAGADLVTSRTSQNGPAGIPAGVNPQQNFGSVSVGMTAYEVDLWGKIRRANEAARARYLATEDAQRTVRQTLVAEVASAYLQLLELDYELEIAQSTYQIRTNSLILTTAREEGGVAAMQDVAQAKILVYGAEASIVDIQRQRELQENLLSILLGRHPGSIKRGDGFASQKTRADVPAGLPSSLLERRPDIRFAEELLVAANADIGEAKAAFYPQLTLTGFYGYQSVAFSELFSGASRAWQFGPAVSVPLFNGGRLRANLKITEAQYQESLVTYQKTVQNAFREVSDGLVSYRRTREFTARQDLRTQANRQASELATIRYEGGVTSYLEVLYSEQELFTAELNLAQARLSELLSVVQLYRALGGGWQTPEPSVAKTE